MSATPSHRNRLLVAAVLFAGVLLYCSESAGQSGRGKRPDFIPADYDDYKHMLKKLGITKMRRGRDGRGKDSSSEKTANRFKDSMPDLMTFKKGGKVKSAKEWPKRRAEIVEEFEREVYGRIPRNVPKVKWKVARTTEGESGGIETVTKTLVGTVDNSAFPKIEVNIQANFTVPRGLPGRAPIIMEFGFGFGGRGGVAPWKQQALEKGWGYGTIMPNSIQGDNNRLREGIIGLCNKGEPRGPEDWGALSAWAWGLGRLIDYFEANKDSGVDPAKVCITGVSRYGKAALVATAFDTRIAAGFVASSGAGGAKLFRRDFGELLENLAGRGGYHWMAGNFLKYAAEESKFGKKTVADLPVDQHELIALCAPRLCFISYGVPEGKPFGDPNWVDAHGSFMAAVLAGPAYRLLGKKDLGTKGDYLTDKMPAVNTLIGGELAWRQHSGGHTNVPNFPTFFEWAGKYISTPAKPKKKGPEEARPRSDDNSKLAHEQRLASLKKVQLAVLDGVPPKVIVLLAGTNNVGNSPASEEKVAEITKGMKSLLDAMRKKAPKATIIVMGILPRNEGFRPTAAMASSNKINEEIARLADGKAVRYLNINNKLADEEGKLLDRRSPALEREGLPGVGGRAEAFAEGAARAAGEEGPRPAADGRSERQEPGRGRIAPEGGWKIG
jgi:lysophospholipase L1-like esterase